jgi:hypothetical protein
VVRRLLAADEDLHGLEVQSAGLAEAFTELTRTEVTQAELTQTEVTQEVR